MLDFVTKTLTAVFGSKSKRDVKSLLPVVDQVNAEYAKLRSLSDNELRGQTLKLKGEINTALASIDKQIAALQQQVADDTSLDVQKKENIYEQIDKLEEERNVELEKTLEKVLPKAFAVVKETARRWKENARLEVDANEMDRSIAARKSNVEIVGHTAIWHNRWMAAGIEVVWEMLHYDVQLMGGMVLHQGKISEMATGEGKTLVATLPAYLNALAGRGVHVVTVNDYLARRDCEWMAPLFEFHGLTIDCIDYHQPHSEQRKRAYLADITYGTNNEFGFDYLRDNMAHSPDELVQRRHHFAMVDEVDSVLIDDARTPLIISGPVPRGDEHEYQELKPRIHQLVEEQRKLAQNFLTEARKKITEGNEKEGGLALFRAYRGLPTYKPLIKFLSEQGMRAVLQKVENYYLQDNQRMMPEADEPLYFVIDEKHNHIDLTDKGIEAITRAGEDATLFVLPDISTELAAIEKASIGDQEKLEKKEALLAEYRVKQERIHTLTQLLRAYTLFEKDVDYIIVDSKVKIVDEQTGRVMEGRRYSDGLHQALEAKENVKIEEATQTYATVTLQNYFRMYHKLCGMTGTAETEATEFWEIYKLDVVVIPTNRNIVRGDLEDKVFKTTREKFNAVGDEILELTKQGRPVLVGTTSVEISELLSRMLKLRNIKHQVLNAKQHQKEAEVVAEAGKPGTVTIATNMAGRGTDIKLTPESRAAGGLAIVGTERHESRRVDRQLRGRAGRQGDPGSSQFFVSLEDNLMRLFGSERIAKVMDMMKLPEGEVIQHSMITKSIERAQKKVEENNFGMRKRLLEYDDVMNFQRKAIYKRRRNALFGDRLEVDVLNMIFDTCEELCVTMKDAQGYESFRLEVIGTFGVNVAITAEEFQKESAEKLSQKLYVQVIAEYGKHYALITERVVPIFKDLLAQRGDQIMTVNMPITDGHKMVQISTNPHKVIQAGAPQLRLAVEKFASLAFIDVAWREHLREMDDLRQYVQNAVYEQKDPLMLYKFEGFELFKKLVARINKETVEFLFEADLPAQGGNAAVQQAPQHAKTKEPAYREAKEEAKSVLTSGSAASEEAPAAEKVQPMRSQKVANRNDKVSVQYLDGTIKRDVKYKVVEDDVLSNRCVLIEE